MELELKILIGGFLIFGAWFMYQDYSDRKKEELRQKKLNTSFKANVIKFKK